MIKKHPLMIRNRSLFLGDLFLIVVAVLGSFVLRLDLGPLFLDHLERMVWMIGIALLIKPIVYYLFGLYRRLWSYASIQELKLIALTVTTASILVSLIITLLQALTVFPGFSRLVLGIDWLLSLFFVGGLRLSLRILAESQMSARDTAHQNRRVLVVGAGDAGALVVREMQKNPQTNLLPICFVDDDPAKQRQEIHGVPVAGTLKDLPRVLDAWNIDEVIIAIPSAAGRVVRSVADICRAKSIAFRTMPGLHELIGGTVSVSRLREVDITDLLRREPAHIATEQIGLNLSGKRVLITGAGGSIGRELCRQVARWAPAEIVLLGHGENSIFEILLELQESFPSQPMHAVIADIRNAERLDLICASHRPQVIFHAAAHKHVPLMEANIEEAITNNVLGTRNIVQAALAHHTERLVMISSDKAICPSSVMGATKRLAEMIVLDAARRSAKPYSVVRFGNVLGSRGSVIHLFKRQIARGGPITITHPDMQRYFMTIPEAVHLVLQAFSMGKSGAVFVLNMGEQIRIVDLAEDLIRLSGLEPGKDIEIVYTGIRPGEKLSEALWDEGADYQPTEHPDVLRLSEDDLPDSQVLQQAIDHLAQLANQGNTTEIVQALGELIPGAAIRALPPPDFTAIV
jgi:FlaA1/EpsC-like NDP-sugar epimerase